MTPLDLIGGEPTDSWVQHSPPTHHDGRTWSLATLVDLADARAEIRAHITQLSVDVPVADDGEAAERALLVADEMASNGIRHAGPPVRLEISAGDVGQCYLISVADQSSELLPEPDRHRDPTQGGLGLQMIAAFSDRHGWSPDDRGKTVWALLPTSIVLPGP